MDIIIKNSAAPAPTKFCNSLSMVIRSFKGRRDVEVHLFRPSWSQGDEQNENWEALIAACPGTPADTEGSRRVILEAFTNEERDTIVDYLKEQYSTRLTAIRSTPLTFPVPAGLSGLTQVEAGKNVGFIEFEKIPSYSLVIPLKGLYDLSQHPPIAED